MHATARTSTEIGRGAIIKKIIPKNKFNRVGEIESAKLIPRYTIIFSAISESGVEVLGVQEFITIWQLPSHSVIDTSFALDPDELRIF